MAYDAELAHRIREQLAGQPGLTEKAMFGGLAFMLHGNITVAKELGCPHGACSVRAKRWSNA